MNEEIPGYVHTIIYYAGDTIFIVREKGQHNLKSYKLTGCNKAN
jgi:hypothetical protein